MQHINITTPLLTLALLLPGINYAETGAPGWYLRTHLGLSQISDLDGKSTDIGTTNGTTAIDLSSGFTGGLNLGYRYNDRWAAEIAWEYRSNDSEVTLADGQFFPDGNYASNIFHLNGIYHLAPTNSWDPYIGLGLSWVQEIDIDLEAANTEQSFSGDGDTGYQVFAGVNYQLNQKWTLNGELRYGDISSIRLTGEDSNGVIDDLDYKPTTLQIGVSYKY